MRPGSIIDDLAEAEPTYLAKQNKELRRLLVECRKELYEVQHSAFGWRSCSVLKTLGAKFACPALCVRVADLRSASCRSARYRQAFWFPVVSTWAQACM